MLAAGLLARLEKGIKVVEMRRLSNNSTSIHEISQAHY